MSNIDITTEQIVESLLSFNDGCDVINTKEVKEWSETSGYKYMTIRNRLVNGGYQSSRSEFNLNKQRLENSYQSQMSSLIPEVDDKFVPFGHFKDIKSVIKSGIFYPLFITGLSGNGKTHSVEQACAQLKRECIRVNVSIETDADDLIGGFRLHNGDTVWSDGPIVEALRRGAVLLLDEIDLASNKIMCLQSVLEGKGVYLKKTNEYVKPAPGFNVCATANTKGRGSDDGKFIGTNVLNEAFLERFAVTFEQSYPSPAIEKKILLNYCREHACEDSDIDSLCQHLVDWSDVIRKTFYDGGIDDVISTRRLVNVIKARAIWGSTIKAIELCTARFDDETSHVFRELYQKVSGDGIDKTPEF